MKLQKGIPLFIALLVSVLLTYTFVNSLVLARAADSQTTTNSLPIIADFETGGVGHWFTYGDWGSGAALDKSVGLTNTLSTVGAVSNTVMLVDYVAAGWGVGVGLDLIPPQDWTDYDGFSFWFQGTNSGVEFKIILTDNDGERLATKFLDDFTGWQELRFPWQVFYHDPDFQPPGAPDDGPTLTAVEAFAFAPASPSAGSYAMDQITLYRETGMVINDFETDDVSGWFDYGDWGSGSALVKSVGLTNTLSTVGAVSNTVMLVDYVSAGWGVGVGQDLIPFQDWSDYDGFSFWFQGTNSGTEFKIILTDNDGERLATKFLDDFTGWQELRFPWQVFYHDPDFQPPGAPNDGPTLTAVEAFAFAPASPSAGSYAMDQIVLFKQIGAVVNDFETDDVSGWFDYGDWGSGSALVKSVGLTNTLSTVGAVSNTVMLVDYVSAGWGVGVGQDLIPFQDWSGYDGLSFWFLGENSGTEFKIILTDNDGERLATKFLDDFTGWQELRFPWQVFYHDPDFQPPGAPNDGPTLTAVEAFAFAPGAPSNGRYAMDQIALFKNVTGPTELQVAFTSQTYSVVEGETVTLTVALSFAITETVTVDYATADGSATSSDYVPVSGTLTFDPGDLTQTIAVETIDNDDLDGDRTFTVQLSDPVNAELGTWSVATVTIQDDEVPDYSGAKTVIVDDFEDGLPSGEDAYGNGIGFVTWGDFWTGTTVAITTTLVADDDPLALPNQSGDNYLLQFDANVNGWGGLTHAFENEDVDTWVTQDWTGYEGISFWLYGQNTGNDLLFEIQDNRNPGSTGNDVEIWSYGFVDNFSGWQQIVLGFDEFVRKEIGNGAPNDGFGRDEVHGWAFGTLNTGGADVTYYLDDVALIVRTTIIDDFEDGLPSGTDANGLGIGFVTWGDSWNGTTVAITTTSTISVGLPAVPGKTDANQVIDLESMVVGWGGFTHAFANEDFDTWVSQDWSTYEGVCFWYYGTGTGTTVFIDILENRNPGSTTDDAERWSYEWNDDTVGWQLIEIPFSELTRKDIGNGAPDDGWTGEEVHGWALGTVSTGGNVENRYVDDFAIYGNVGGDQELRLAFAASSFSVVEGETADLIVTLNMTVSHPVSVTYATAESNARPYQYTPASGTLNFPAGTLTQTISIDTYHDGKHTRDVRVAVNLYEEDVPLGFQRRTILTIVDIDPVDPRLVDDFQGAHPFIYQSGDVDLSITTLTDDNPLAVPGQWAYEDVLTVEYDGASSFGRVFAQGQDWSGYDGLSFWFYGQNSGDTFTFQLRENMAATTAEVDPEDWVLVWSDEFDDPAGTPPNPNVWKYELGDGALNNIVGWGNSEFQYYTDSTDNSFMDGNGNLVIRLQEADPDDGLVCWYGPCEYTSARLLTQDRLDFEYGRIEARVLVPDGPGGLWPAFWMLGSNIPEVGWPQSGEIDIMEYVSRLPNEIFGTIHGPGYQGGASFGNIYNFGEPVANDYHTYAVEWMPDLIIWYVDDIQYHEAVPANVSPNEWVFNHPFFMLLNAAIGGNFGGAISGDMTFPQDTLVDYVRVYQAADTAERFEASFVDDFTGWRKIRLSFSDFTRSTDQPVGAPDDGLTLTEVWGYDFVLPDGSGLFHLDRVYLETDLIYYLPIIFRN
jgi:beta-glucanase (GH16 family)